jgi:hypothetical protein
MYYIRFLKRPSIKRSNNKILEYVIEARIIVNTDLQDALLQHDLAVIVTVQDAAGAKIQQQLQWLATSRHLDVSISFRTKKGSQDWILPCRMFISAIDVARNQDMLEGLDKVIFAQQKTSFWGVQPVWSSEIRMGQTTDSRVERILRPVEGMEIKIWEDTGTSLTAHIWYGILCFRCPGSV